MRFSVYLDVGRGACMAHVLGELLGCNATGQNRRRALMKLRADIVEYSRRLGRAAPRRIELRVVEVSRNLNPWIAGGTNALFSPERGRATDREIERCIRRMRRNRIELLRLVRGANLRRRLRDDPRSIRETLVHIANAEVWYLTRIGRASCALPVDPFERLKAARAFAVRSLRTLTDGERSDVFVPRTFCSRRMLKLREPWTARKVLRRLLEHERQHTRYIRRRLGSMS